MTKLKLTDTERVILASAGARETGLVLPVPKSMKLSPTKVEPILSRLLTKGLLLERPSLTDEQPWSQSEDATRNSLVVSPLGLAAVGLETVDDDAAVVSANRSRPKGKVAAKSPAGSKRPLAKPNPEVEQATPDSAPAGRATKLDILIAALRQRKGATIAELMEATGWQAHSLRGSISGALKKRMNLNVVSKAVEGRGRVYRIEAETAK